MKFYNLLISTLILGTVVGCGGGGGSTSDSSVGDVPDPTPTVEASPAPTVTPTVTPMPSVESLVAEQSFEFNTEKTLNLHIDSAFDGEHFISLCRVNAADNTSNYDDCLFSGFVTLDAIQTTWTVANDVEQLALSVWQPQHYQQAQLFHWQHNSGESWQVNYE